jgi:hypothetical protein
MAEMGFDAFFFARLDYQDKDRRLADKEMEYIWRPSWEELGENAQIFTHALYAHYSAPSGFDFDTRNTDDAIVDDPRLTSYNVDHKAAKLYDHFYHQMQHYKSQKNMFQTWGDDFHFMNSHKYFYSLDALIDYWNEVVYPQTNIELIYSTPRIYIDALIAEELTWPTKYDDIFPYADDSESFWTGYFTSRANDKKYFRDGSHTLHSSNKLFALEGIDQGIDEKDVAEMQRVTEVMKDVVGIVQHHDAITGTAKQHVSNDYKERVYKGTQEVNKVYAAVVDKLAQTQGFKEDNTWQWCQRQNGTYTDCPIADWADQTDYNMVVATHNPAGIAINDIMVKVPHDNFVVQTFNGTTWSNITASVICQVHQDETHPNYQINDCNLYVKQTILPGQIGFTKLTYDATAHLHEDTCDDVS